MSFLRRMLGGGGSRPERATGAGVHDDAAGGGDPEAEEAARDRQLLAEEGRRLSDEFLARQLRYADRSWKPPAQGGTRRAEDAEGSERD